MVASAYWCSYRYLSVSQNVNIFCAVCSQTQSCQRHFTGKLQGQVPLELSAAFDTADHDIFLSRFETVVSVSGVAQSWFPSRLSVRSQTVSCPGRTSYCRSMAWDVLQGSVLGPLVFCICMRPLELILQNTASVIISVLTTHGCTYRSIPVNQVLQSTG